MSPLKNPQISQIAQIFSGNLKISVFSVAFSVKDSVNRKISNRWFAYPLACTYTVCFAIPHARIKKRRVEPARVAPAGSTV